MASSRPVSGVSTIPHQRLAFRGSGSRLHLWRQCRVAFGRDCVCKKALCAAKARACDCVAARRAPGITSRQTRAKKWAGSPPQTRRIDATAARRSREGNTHAPLQSPRAWRPEGGESAARFPAAAQTPRIRRRMRARPHPLPCMAPRRRYRAMPKSFSLLRGEMGAGDRISSGSRGFFSYFSQI